MEIHANNIIMEDDSHGLPHAFCGYANKTLNNKPIRKTNPEQLRLNASSKKSFVKNMRQNANKELLKTLGFGVLGALIYPLVPTVLQAITERDMSGAKGMLTGVGTASLLGLGFGKPEIAIGAISAAGTHILYSKGTKMIENLTNTQIFRMNPGSVVYSQQA